MRRSFLGALGVSLAIGAGAASCGDDAPSPGAPSAGAAGAPGGGGGAPGAAGAGAAGAAGGRDAPAGSSGGAATGGAAGAGGSAGAGGGSSEGPPSVDVGPAGPYGSHTFVVPAGANWVNTGLSLKAGETARVSAAGTWRAGGGNEGVTGPEGSTIGQQRGCNVGSFAVRLGLPFEGPLVCVGAGKEVVADRDGVLFAGAVVGTDLGDAYEDRLENQGELSVTVESQGATVPVVSAPEAATYPFDQVASGWVELRGRHVLITAPAAQALADRAYLGAALGALDHVYDLHAELRGRAPYRGDRIRFYPDPTIGTIGYMVAGNPVRVAPEVFTNEPPLDHLLRSGEPAHSIWGFAHEMGHDFTFAGGFWWYQIDTLEAWCNIFSVHALRALGRGTHDWGGGDPAYPPAAICPNRAAYLQSGTYEAFKADYGLQLCFFLNFEEKYGFPFYAAVFAAINGADPNEVDPSQPARAWGWVRDRFSAAAGEDVTPDFQAWHIPLP